MAKKPDKAVLPLRERLPNEDDLFVDALRDSCARAMATWMKEGINTDRQIRSLTLAELKAMAEACTAHWIVEVSKRITANELSPKLQEYENLLLG